MKIMALDLELNQPSQSIIQIGVAWGDIADKKPQAASWVINPAEALDPFIITLTGLTQDQVSNGLSMQQAYNELCRLHQDENCYPTLVVWGSGDLRLLKRQSPIPADGKYNSWRFGSHSIDAKSLYQTWKLSQGEPHLKGGLARALTKVGCRFAGRKHNAMDDAYNTWIIYQHFVRKMKND